MLQTTKAIHTDIRNVEWHFQWNEERNNFNSSFHLPERSAPGGGGGGGALGPNMYGCVPLRCCDFYPVWEHFPQFKYPRLGAKWQKTTPCLGAKDQENTL